MAINKSAVRFQESVAYTQAKVNERLLGTPLIGNVVSFTDTFIFSHGLSRGIQQSHAYDEVMRENFEHLKARGLVTGEDWQNIQYRTAEEWIQWYKTEGKLIPPKSDIGYEITQVFKMMNDPKYGEGYRKDWNKIMNEDIKDFNAPVGKGQGGGTGFGVLQPNTGIIPVAGEMQDVKPGQMSETQRLAADVLKGATDISQVEKVAKDFGIDISNKLKFQSDKSVEGYKNAVLNVIRENEQSPFTINRNDKTIYAPPVTTQNRTNYFTKVQQPETIKWDSKYVPQAATYGGAGAFNYTEPETYRDPERPWLDDYYDARASTPNINWNDFVSQNYQPTANFHPASMYGSNLNPVFNQGNYPQGYNTPQIITQPANPWWDDSINVWDLGMAELIAIINYDPMPKKNILELAEDK